jgi:uncharacterized protein (TIRG00374 family)
MKILMSHQAIVGLLWLVGLGVLGALGLFVGLEELIDALVEMDATSILAWIGITFLSRIILVEALSRPIAALGGRVSRTEVFWAGWLRSFFNQVLPMAGTAYLASFLRKRTTLSWGEMAALASPQILFATLSIGVVGTLAALIVTSRGSESNWVLITTFVCIAIAAMVVISGSKSLQRILPVHVEGRLSLMLRALAVFHSRLQLMLWVILVHCSAIFLRALRLWVLFSAIGQPLEIYTVLLISCVGEIAIILQLTPGGIGVREGTLVGTAYIIGLDPASVATVAVLDRLLILAMVTGLAPVSMLFLRRADDDSKA